MFDSVNFCDPPRGILTLDEDVIISKYPRAEGDGAGDMALIIQGGGQRWKLCSEAPGEINRWEEVGAASTSLIVYCNCTRSLAASIGQPLRRHTCIRADIHTTYATTAVL